MRTISAICLSLLLFSCVDHSRETGEINQLNQRIIRLEQRLDSLINDRNPYSIGSKNMKSPNTASYNAPPESGRCQAMTKKGTQCKRKSKSNGYCWQHGG